MPTMNVEFEVFCGTCGEGLCNQSETDDRGRYPAIRVEVCPKCLKAAKEEAYDEGYEQGMNDNESNNSSKAV